MERKENKQTLGNNIVISTRVHMTKMSTIRIIPLNSPFLGTYQCKCLSIGGKWLLCNYVLGMQALWGFQVDRCTLHVDNQKVSNGTRKQWKKKILKNYFVFTYHPSFIVHQWGVGSLWPLILGRLHLKSLILILQPRQGLVRFRADSPLLPGSGDFMLLIRLI